MMLREHILSYSGLGHLSKAPGTLGSIATAIFVALVVIGFSAAGGLEGAGRWGLEALWVVLILLMSAATIGWGDWAENHSGKADPAWVIIDEGAGQILAFIGAPWLIAFDAASIGLNLAMIGVGLLAFRFFDVLKPFPINRIQRLPKGWGVLLDDIASGAIALGIVQLVAWTAIL
jgi:phosphatidylglycerophosphatase A